MGKKINKNLYFWMTLKSRLNKTCFFHIKLTAYFNKIWWKAMHSTYIYWKGHLFVERELLLLLLVCAYLWINFSRTFSSAFGVIPIKLGWCMIWVLCLSDMFSYYKRNKNNILLLEKDEREISYRALFLLFFLKYVIFLYMYRTTALSPHQRPVAE